MKEEAYNILLPFNYLIINELPLKERYFLAYQYNEFIRRYIWQFIDAYNYQFANSKKIRFCLQTAQNFIFEGELFEEKKSLFRAFKVNSNFLHSTTDFTEWEQLVALENLEKLEYLEFDFINHWFSVPNEAFFARFQQLKELTINCECTEGFNNLIDNVDAEIIKKLPHTKVTVNITGGFYY